MNKSDIIYVAGHTGLAGSAITKELTSRGYCNLRLKPHNELDLRNSEDVEYYFKKNKIRGVFLAAAHAGGILEAVKNPAWMCLDNLEIISNVIRASFLVNVDKLIFLASSCVYPVNAPQPYKEEDIGSGKTDENWSYAVAKLAGIELCRAFNRQYDCKYISVLPCNLYGPHDNFDPRRSHVIPALISKIHESDTIELWGDGTARREFLYSADFARASVDIFERGNEEVINIGSGLDISILDLVLLVGSVVRPGEEIKVVFNNKMPNGVPSKLMDNSKITSLGWKPCYTLTEGIKLTYEFYKARSHS